MKGTDMIEKLNELKQKVETLKGTRERLVGELAGSKRQMKELEDKCRSTYEVEISELPSLIRQLNEEAEKALANAEKILVEISQDESEVND